MIPFYEARLNSLRKEAYWKNTSDIQRIHNHVDEVIDIQSKNGSRGVFICPAQIPGYKQFTVAEVLEALKPYEAEGYIVQDATWGEYDKKVHISWPEPAEVASEAPNPA
jgi:hypothetical protein